LKALLLLLFALVAGASGSTVQLFTGETLNGEIEFGDTLAVRTEAGPTVKVDLPNARSISIRERAAQFGPGVVLRNGIRLKQGAAGETPPSEIARIFYRPITTAEERGIPSGKTGALLVGGDFFEGKISRADDKSVKVISPLFGPRTFEAARGDVLAAVLAAVQHGSAAAYEVETIKGELFLADAASISTAGLTLQAGGKTQLVPAAEIAEIRAGSGRAFSLALARPANTQFAPGITPARGMSIDALPDGSALQIGPDRFEKGLSLASGSAASWEVPPGFAEMVGRCGVAPTTPANVRLTFIVLADGRSIFRSPPMTSADSPQTIRAPLGRARVITLRVETQFPAGAVGLGVWTEPTLLQR
jgi:hypothetical protein